jgi:4,5-dihydroxyphthalate decarboxylase
MVRLTSLQSGGKEMQPLTLKTAIATYGHTRALKDGSVAPLNISLDHVEVSPIIAAFRRMVRGLEFDVSEMAISTYLCAKANNKAFTAIPVFPLRAFHHGGILANTKLVKQPKDLAGKKVGVRAYTVTGGLWVRGFLQNDYGVDMSRVTWVVVDEEHVQEYQLPRNVQKAPEGKDLKEMLIAGELAAAIGVGAVDHPDVAPLIPDAREVGIQYFKRKGVYPINHTLVI